MPFAQVHYPFENKDWFESHFPGRLHRRVRRADARLVLHADGAGDGAVRQARRSATASATASCSTRTGRSCRKRLKNYPDPVEVFDTLRRRRAALVHGLLAAAARAATSPCRQDGTAIARVVRQVHAAALERLFVLHACTPTPTASRRSCAATRRGRARPLHPRQDARSWSRAVERRMDGSTSPAPATRCRRFIDALNNWYIRRSARALLAAAARTPTSATPTTRSTPCW